MDEYLFREARQKDIPFIADTVIAAEKGRSDKLSFSTLFNISESKAKELIITMLGEEIDGCELSLSSFLVAECSGETVAAIGSWIEGFDGAMPSKILKSNLILHTFGKESMEFFKTKSHLIKDVLIEREPLTLQFEYLYIADKHLGKGLDTELTKRSEEKALAKYPALQKVQTQLFKNNILAVIVLRKKGFNVVSSCRTGNEEVLNYIPFNEKLLMEKSLKE
ncbi:MAG TPA: hypothetical protein VK498_07905 [Ferruginibacter sp.]|nr:hypothetical protein [Ferruginibacter sp.]